MKSLVEFIAEAKANEITQEEFDRVLEFFPEEKFGTKLNKRGSKTTISMTFTKENVEDSGWKIPDTKLNGESATHMYDVSRGYTHRENGSMKVTISRPNRLNGNFGLTIKKETSYAPLEYNGPDKKGLKTIDDVIENILKRLSGKN